MRVLDGPGKMDVNRTLARDWYEQQVREARAKRNHRLRLGLFEGVIGTAGFWLLADVGGWKLALAFFLITWGANIRAKRISA